MGAPPKEVIEYGCFFCGKGKGTDLTGTCPECSEPLDVANDLMKLVYEGLKPTEALGRGFYGQVLKATNRIGKQFALKVVPATLYEQRAKDFYDEVERYQVVGKHPNIAELYSAGEQEADLRGKPVYLYFLVMEYIEGPITFNELMKTASVDIDMFVGIAVQLGAALSKLGDCNLRHDDLHGRNIVLTQRDLTDYDHHAATNLVVKLLDLGSAVFGHARPRKPTSDIEWYARHLSSMLDHFATPEGPMSPVQLHFLRGAERTFVDAFDPDPSRRPEPGEVVKRIQELRDRSFSTVRWTPPELPSAFSYLNALSFPDASYVATLFSDRFPWLREILSAEQPLLLTGPRGCGKTMALRHAHLQTLLSPRVNDGPDARKERLTETPHLGFFLSCRESIHIYLATGTEPAWVRDPALTIAFFTLLCWGEVTDTLVWADTAGIALVTESEAAALLDLFHAQFASMLPPHPKPKYGGLTVLENLRTSIAHISDALINSNIDPDNLDKSLSTSRPLRELASHLTKHITSFQGKRVLFLLDDFSTGIVPESVQRALLPIAFAASPEYCFWVSAHGLSVPLLDLSDVAYQANREFIEINFGWEYAKRSSTQLAACQEYLEDVFRRRFENERTRRFVGKQLAELLGTSTYTGNLALHIRSLAENKTLRTLNYHGFETIAQLCTGDISYLIDLVGRILSDLNGQSPPVTPTAQNQHIRQYARWQLLKLLDTYDNGEKLYEVAKTFGNIVKSKLLGKLQENGDPPEYLSIELKRARRLSDECESWLRELVREGVFISGPGTNSSDGEVTLMLLYRRLFVPAAPASLNDRNTFPWSPARMEKFLRDPRSFLAEEVGKDTAKGNTLFDDLDELQDD
jgi:serine/threonine protein kinase